MGAVADIAERWSAAQEYEAGYWRLPGVADHEATKQRRYASYMGLRTLDLRGRSVVDIGGGPASLLLQCSTIGSAAVVDPLTMPSAARARYADHGIELVNARAEDFDGTGFDEAWVYNVLGHTVDPFAVLRAAQRAARVVRLFDWLDDELRPGHLHRLSEVQIAPFLDFYRLVRLEDELLVGTAIVGVWLA